MASLNQWTWIWVKSGRSSRTEKPGMLQSMGSKRVGCDWATEQQQPYVCRSDSERGLTRGMCFKSCGYWNCSLESCSTLYLSECCVEGFTPWPHRLHWMLPYSLIYLVCWMKKVSPCFVFFLIVNELNKQILHFRPTILFLDDWKGIYS